MEVATLLNEIESSTSRISELVLAIKEYTFMDQSPLQNVDIVKGLENTLTILNHKLKRRGVQVQRDYEQIPLLVNSFGSELNQVWTNLIDNAIDAMGDNGELRFGLIARIPALSSKFATMVQGFRPRSNRTFLSLSLPPRESGRAQALGSILCSEL